MNDIKHMTLPTDSNERKNYPMLAGVLRYFPAALAGVAKISKLGNDKHNPGQPMHHARGKSTDHGDCIIRHLTDTEDLLARLNRSQLVDPEHVLVEASQLAWRALAYAQELHEKFGAPLAPGAVLPARELAAHPALGAPYSMPDSREMGASIIQAHNGVQNLFSVGDKVRIKQLSEADINDFPPQIGFAMKMVNEFGEVGEVIDVDSISVTVKTGRLDSEWSWPDYYLERIS